MALTFDDLIRQCQPAMAKNSPAGFTEGRTWAKVFRIVDKETGDPFDLTGCTGECKLYDFDDWTEVVSLDVALSATGEVTVSKDQTGTVGLAAGERQRRCRWGLVITLAGTPTKSAQIWSPFSSEVPIQSDG